MKTKLISAAVIAIAALGSVNAFAMNRLEGEAATKLPPIDYTSNVSRAQVLADVLQARKDGTLPINSEVSLVVVPATSQSVTRAEIRLQAAMSPIKDGHDGTN